jgi:hypothetical protein
MRELKCGLNLPSVIGQTLSFLVANPRPSGISPRSRRPNTPLPRRYSSKPGIAVFIGRHIFNRSFRNDVNARAIPCCGLISYLPGATPIPRPGSICRSTITGSVNANVEPCPGCDSTQILPPCISMTRFDTASPRPVPPGDSDCGDPSPARYVSQRAHHCAGVVAPFRTPRHMQIDYRTGRLVGISRHAHIYENTAIIATALDINARLCVLGQRCRCLVPAGW